jgi:hypothetical protein
MNIWAYIDCGIIVWGLGTLWAVGGWHVLATGVALAAVVAGITLVLTS